MPYTNIKTKTSLQFKLGSPILKLIDKHRSILKLSRNKWVTDAIVSLIENGDPTPCRITAESLFLDKTTVMVRLDPLISALVNDHSQERHVTKTTWLTDACLSKLADPKASLINGH
jgi:hypothetical protein